MNQTDTASDTSQLREALQRQLDRGHELLQNPDLNAEQLEAWSRSISHLSERLSDTLGDPVRNQVRRILDSPGISPDENAIVVLRLSFGYGQRELARLANVSLPTVTRTLEGEGNPSPGVAKSLADIWHLGVLELFDVDYDTNKLTPRTVEDLLATMKARDEDQGSASWIRANPEA